MSQKIINHKSIVKKPPSLRVVANFLFLRFISAGMTSPVSHGLCTQTPTTNGQKTLTKGFDLNLTIFKLYSHYDFLRIDIYYKTDVEELIVQSISFYGALDCKKN